jgi:hypothetical protein
MRKSSLAGEFWGGYCPECLTPESDMRLNSNDNWECPLCHLQIQAEETILILPNEGIGSFMKSHGSFLSVSRFAPMQAGRIMTDLRF